MGIPVIPSVDSDTKLFPAAVMTAMSKALTPNVLWQNINLGTMAKARAAFAAARAGTAAAKVLCVGDSTTIGALGTVAQSYPSYLTAALNTTMIAKPGLSIPPLQGTAVDNRWAYNGWVAITSFGWGDGCALLNDGTVTGTAQYAPGVDADTFDVYYYGTGGYGTIRATLDTGETVDVNAGNAGGTVRKFTLTAAAVKANHTIGFANTGQLPIAILGVDAYVAAKPSVRVGNAGVNGSTSARWGDANGTPTGYGSAAAIRLYAPDLTIIMLGINDAQGNVSAATLQANLTKTITAAKASGSVIIMSVVPSSDATVAATEASYRAALPAFAAAQGVGYIDVFARFDSYASSQPLGFYSDTLHPSPAGYADMAAVIAQALRSI